MTYDATIQGNSRPVEFYEFVQEAVFTRVTSADGILTFNSLQWTPLEGLHRSGALQNSESSSGEITLVVPDTFSIATQFRGTIPSSLPSLTIYQRLENDADGEGLAIWKGIVASCAFKDHRAELLCLPTTRLLQRIIPRRVYSGQCNHHLYDGACQVVRDTYKFTGTVTTIGTDPTQLTFSGLRARAAEIDTNLSLGLSSAELDSFWMRGIIVLKNTPEERRTIVETVIGADPNVVRVSIPFRGITTGDPVEILAGCTHDIDICDRKFQNAINFGGFPYVPGSINNPFNIELGSGSKKD